MWIPELGLSFTFLVDELSLFFGALVLGVGLLVALYARSYFGRGARELPRFFVLLAGFALSMLGTVFSDNLIVLCGFWELTGLFSFFLVGFSHEQARSRVAARRAWLVSFATGLSLLAGCLILTKTTGCSSFSQLLSHRANINGQDPRLFVALLLMLIGALGKSAQFPFYFWLPGAMTAPTPASAYLHSATMVKLGVFLCLRLIPLWSLVPSIAWIALVIGLLTFILGAALSFLSHELKTLLAYATVSYLGYLIAFQGLAALSPFHWNLLSILHHALYKGALFMIAGIMTHASGEYDLRRMGGLKKALPGTALVASLAVASAAGFPGTLGFLTKTLFKADLAEAPLGGMNGVVLAVTFAAQVLTNAALLRLVIHGFFRPAPSQERPLKSVSCGLWLPPFVLVALALCWGLFPQSLVGPALQTPELRLWSPWTLAFSVFVYLWGDRKLWNHVELPRWIHGQESFEFLLEGVMRLARNSIQWFGTDSPSRVFTLSIVLAGALLLGPLLSALKLSGILSLPWHTTPLRLVLALGIIGLIGAVFFSTRLLVKTAWLSASGLLLVGYLIVFRAPDLALTQSLIESASLLLILYLVGKLREKEKPLASTRSLRWLWALLGGVGFAGLTALTAAWTPGATSIGSQVLHTTQEWAHGANAVNTLIIDYRGYDTFGEITVLVIAALGIHGLRSRRRIQRPTPKKVFLFESSPVIDSLAFGIFILMNVLAVHLFWRGHQRPGGGFVAGLLTTLSLVWMGWSKGRPRALHCLPTTPLNLAFFGLFWAILTAAAPLLWGHAFLTHFMWGPIGTPVSFDAGVALVVIGVASEILLETIPAQEEPPRA